MAGENLCARTGTPSHAEACYIYTLSCTIKTHSHSAQCEGKDGLTYCPRQEHTHEPSGPSICHTKSGPFC